MLCLVVFEHILLRGEIFFFIGIGAWHGIDGENNAGGGSWLTRVDPDGGMLMLVTFDDFDRGRCSSTAESLLLCELQLMTLGIRDGDMDGAHEGGRIDCSDRGRPTGESGVGSVCAGVGSTGFSSSPQGRRSRVSHVGLAGGDGEKAGSLGGQVGQGGGGAEEGLRAGLGGVSIPSGVACDGVCSEGAVEWQEGLAELWAEARRRCRLGIME